MSVQGSIVAVIVIACCGYAVWTLMPGAARRAMARALLKLPLPAAINSPLRRAAAVTSSCGCDGCDRSERAVSTAVPESPRPVVVKFYSRAGR